VLSAGSSQCVAGGVAELQIERHNETRLPQAMPWFAAIHGVLDDQHAETVCVVVEASRFDLNVLADAVEPEFTHSE